MGDNEMSIAEDKITEIIAQYKADFERNDREELLKK